MTTKSSNNDKILESFNSLFDNLSEQDKLDNDAKLIMFHFLDIIERKRDKLGWTRKQLGESIGTSASYITQLFRGDKLLNMPTLAKMQKALNLKFEISEKTSYKEMTQEVRPPVSDGKGMWFYKSFDKPNYNSDKPIPKVEFKEEAA